MEYNFNWIILSVINLVVLFSVVTEGRLRIGGYGGHIGYSLGAACEYDDDCLPAHSYCRRQEVCDCKRGFVPSDDGSQCLTLVGSFCQTNYDCSSLEHSECRQEMCQCEQRFIPNDGGSKCLPKAASYRSDCTLDAQCKASMGEASFCNRGRCECLPHNHYSELESRCFLNKGLFQMCRNSSECYIGDYWTSFIECSRGQCNCRYGYYVTDNNKCGSTGTTYTTIGASTVLLVTALLNATWKSVLCNL